MGGQSFLTLSPIIPPIIDVGFKHLCFFFHIFAAISEMISLLFFYCKTILYIKRVKENDKQN